MVRPHARWRPLIYSLRHGVEVSRGLPAPHKELPFFLARLCDLLLNVFDFFRVMALAIQFHEVIESPTTFFRLLELEYVSVTGSYLAFCLLLGCSADIRTLDGGVTFLLTEVAYPRAFLY